MTDTNNGATEETAASDTTTTQDEVRTYTQDEVDAMIGKAKGNIESRIAKKYEGIDVDEYKQLKEEREKALRKEQLKKGEYEKIIEEQASKFNAEREAWEKERTEYKINTPLIDALSSNKAVNPDQARKLLKDEFRVVDGVVEVLDSEGKPRFNDDGKHFTVEDRVREFLDSNPHFVQATPSTTNSNSNHSVAGTGDLDITKLDMRDPEDRAKYAEWRKKHGII